MAAGVATGTVVGIDERAGGLSMASQQPKMLTYKQLSPVTLRIHLRDIWQTP